MYIDSYLKIPFKHVYLCKCKFYFYFVFLLDLFYLACCLEVVQCIMYTDCLYNTIRLNVIN